MFKFILQQFTGLKKLTYFLFPALIYISSTVLADSPPAKHEYSDNTYQAYSLPNNTAEVSLVELYRLKSEYESKFKSLQKKLYQLYK